MMDEWWWCGRADILPLAGTQLSGQRGAQCQGYGGVIPMVTESHMMGCKTFTSMGQDVDGFRWLHNHCLEEMIGPR